MTIHESEATMRQPLPVENRLSSSAARIPEQVSQSPGIVVQGRLLRSFAFTTDAAIARNTNADAILAVYPFTGDPTITQALLSAARAPLFVGVGGGTTTGPRVIQLAMIAEMQGVSGVVLNAPSPTATVYDVSRAVNVPVIATVTACNGLVDEKIDAGAAIINVAAGGKTPHVVREIKQRYPLVPLIATGGGTPDSMLETIASGADALSWTPPSIAAWQHSAMEHYRCASEGFAMPPQSRHGKHRSPSLYQDEPEALLNTRNVSAQTAASTAATGSGCESNRENRR